jgi:hypothetical protein
MPAREVTTNVGSRSGFPIAPLLAVSLMSALCSVAMASSRRLRTAAGLAGTVAHVMFTGVFAALILWAATPVAYAGTARAESLALVAHILLAVVQCVFWGGILRRLVRERLN